MGASGTPATGPPLQKLPQRIVVLRRRARVVGMTARGGFVEEANRGQAAPRPKFDRCNLCRHRRRQRDPRLMSQPQHRLTLRNPVALGRQHLDPQIVLARRRSVQLHR